MKARTVLLMMMMMVCFVMASEFSPSCTTSKRCKELFTDKYECDPETKICIREKFTYSLRETIGFLILTLLISIANAGGSGGGGTLVPIFIFFFEFASAESIPLTKISMLISSGMMFFFNWNERYKKNKNSLVLDFGICAIVVPLMLAGSQIGVVFSQFSSPLLTLLLAEIFVLYCLVKICQRAIAQTRQGSAIQDSNSKDKTENEIASNINYPVKLSVKDSEYDQNQKEIEGNEKNSGLLGEDLGDRLNENESENYELLKTGKLKTTLEIYRSHWLNFVFLFISFSISMLVLLLRGSESVKSIIGIEKCGMKSNLILISSQLVTILFSYWIYKYNIDNKHEFSLFQDIKNPDQQNLIKNFVLQCYFGGFLSGFLGVAGGVYYGAYLLGIGVSTDLMVGFCGFTLLWVCLSTNVQYLFIGAIHLRHAIILGVVSILGSFLGVRGLRALIDYIKKPSFLLWVMVLTIVIPAIYLPIDMVYKAITKPEYSFKFGSVC